VTTTHRKHHKGVLLIAILKLVKGTLLVLTGLGALSLVGKDVSEIADKLMRWLHVDPDGRIFYAIVERVSFLDDHRLRQISAGTFFYATLLYTEGFGLWFEKRWAEWLTIIATSTFIPIEIYEIVRHARPFKVALLVLNVVIVLYLVSQLREEKRGHKDAAA
jgi:uncharacterized membrane protein (DUF2068 family)